MINTLHLGLSYKCNMKCKHCFVNKNNDNLDVDRIKETLDYLDSQGLFFVIYTFGEPLLSKKFWAISNYISSKNIVQTLMTNGSLINDKNIILLQQNNIKNIYVSLDSVYETKHDNNRNFNGSYQKAINALKMLSKYNFNVGMAVTINDDNVDEMEKFVELAKEIGINNISFLRQRYNNKLVPMSKEEKYEKFYENYLCNYNEININILFHDHKLLRKTKILFDNNKISKNIYEKYIDMNSCHYKTTLSIEPNGNVKNCNLINNVQLGNINDNNIDQILNKGGIEDGCFSCCAKFSE